MVTTISGIAKIIGVKGLRNMCSDYASYGEKYKYVKSLRDVEDLLFDYRDTDYIIDKFNHNRNYFETEYMCKNVSLYIPYHKTDDFKNQCNDLRRDGLCATDFI